MKEDFSRIKFNGNFRIYQQRILDNAQKYLDDGKINIVAAPGSGKTILGLELIRRLQNPTIILTPTTTIQYQWGSRFGSAFVDASDDSDKYFSYSLKDIKLINSITYQALYSAMKKTKCDSEEETVDYSEIDLFNLMKEKGIKTICLDEAHHLQNEWQKALETFIFGLDKDVKIISLTATPPYDAARNEWERYQAVCGEIDEEIFVPELIKEGTLCPHQDYIYFNYPTASELDEFASYKQNAAEAIEEIKTSGIISRAYNNTIKNSRDYDKLFSNVSSYVGLLTLCGQCGIEVDRKLVKLLTESNKLPKYKLEYANSAINFMLEDATTISEEDKVSLKDILKRHSLVEKGTVSLSLNEGLKRKLASSTGKLDSISHIVDAETKNLGSGLRMLILTDFIRKEALGDIGTNNPLTNISIVSIFETIRRNLSQSSSQFKISVVSGSLIILPDEVIASEGITKGIEKIGDTNYSICSVSNSNKENVALVTRLFEEGKFQILIGTKSLLGEGWDSPCINSLILASFVGSFMLSNQIRGRAIRTNKNDPNKISNIWHLITLEPDYLFADTKTEQIDLYLNHDNNEIDSDDYNTVSRRFECFVGPSYDSGEIENGIDRISILKPPFNKSGIEKINNKMLQLASDRQKVKTQWQGEINSNTKLRDVSIVPKEKVIAPFTFANSILTFTISMVSFLLFQAVVRSFVEYDGFSSPYAFLQMVVAVILVGLGFKMFVKALANLSPVHTLKVIGKALLKTLKKLEIVSFSTRIKVVSDKQSDLLVLLLENASIKEQNIFNEAIAELMSPIANPRYILIMKRLGVRKYSSSYACPSIIGTNKEYVETFKEELKKHFSNFDIVYTRNEDGRGLILKCRRCAFITKNNRFIKRKKTITRYE